jgi:predicted nucleic acid-binding protein
VGGKVLRARVAALPSDTAIYTSVISVGELAVGIQLAPPEHRERLRTRTQEMLGRFREILEVTPRVAERYGALVAQVPPGLHIGQNDYWIAAIAGTHDLMVITNDPDFDRVPGIPKDNWLE